MAAFDFTYKPNSESMYGGKANTPGTGMRWQVVYTGSIPDEGDTFTFTMNDSQTNGIIRVGAGDTTSIDPSYCFTYHNKEYLIALAKVLFSAIGAPTVFNDSEGLGNGFVDMDNQTQVPEALAAMAPFQGKLAFFARRSVQIWQEDADPANWAFLQVLTNIGTVAKDSVRTTGDLDALFLADTGIASLRARETTGNAFVDDLGAAIATLVKEKLALDEDEGANACAVIEPTTGQYWLYLYDTIFVLSYYPSSKVLAWSKYEPKDSQGLTFEPEKFVVFQGQVFCRAGNIVYAYGGANKQTYDDILVTIETPWLDLKTPGTMKSGVSLNAAYTGWWKIYVSMDPGDGVISPTPTSDSGNKHSFNRGIIPVEGYGTHVKFKMTSQHSDPAIFSSIVFNYQLNEKV